MIDPARIARLLVWAQRNHPDHPNWGRHDYIGDCPWCRGDEPRLPEGGAHTTAAEVLTELDRLMVWLGAAEATLLAALDGRQGWRNDATLLVAALYGETITPS